MIRHPEIDISPYFVSCSKSFKDYVMDALKNSGSATQRGDEITKINEDCRNSDLSLIEWKNKLAALKQKFNTGKKDTISSIYKTQPPHPASNDKSGGWVSREF